MSSAKIHIQGIIGAVENLGYTFTDEFFDFDSYPTSGDDKVYRLETQTGEITGLSGRRVEKKMNFDIWTAFKLDAAGNRKQDTYDVLDAREALEDDILQAVSDIQVKITQNVMSPIKNDYILVKLSGQLIYWRDVS